MVQSVSRLARELRARGARVGLDELVGAHRALAAVDPADRRKAYMGCARLCSCKEDLPRFDVAF